MSRSASWFGKLKAGTTFLPCADPIRRRKPIGAAAARVIPVRLDPELEAALRQRAEADQSNAAQRPDGSPIGSLRPRLIRNATRIQTVSQQTLAHTLTQSFADTNIYVWS